MKKALTISIIINFIFILFGGYVIHLKGGMNYFKEKVNFLTDKEEDGYTIYYKEKKSIYEVMPNDTNQIIFLGDSFTDYCEWSELFGRSNIKNRGINGDVINGVIDRLDEVVESKPKKIFLMIGINDLGENRTVNQILIDYDRLILLIKEKLPETELFIQSVLPTDNRKGSATINIVAINKGVQELANNYQSTYINLFDLLRTNENKLDTAYTIDGLHLNGKGYLIWKKAIENYVNEK